MFNSVSGAHLPRPQSFFPGKAGFLRCGVGIGTLLLLPCLTLTAGPIQAQPGSLRTVSSASATPSVSPSGEARRALHQQEAWLTFAAHLPNPASATPAELETAGDVLRARRYPDDALNFYTDALQRGGDQERLLNKLGVTELGLRHIDLARRYLKLALKQDHKNAEAWNNLGAAEYLDGHAATAVSTYRHAIKLAPRSAVFHANLATALIERKKYDAAGVEFAKALDLDPQLGAGHETGAGISAHVLSASDQARYCFEMAKIYAARADRDNMLHWLAKASESGMDLGATMSGDATLDRYRKDPQIVLLIQNTRSIRKPAPMQALSALPAALPVAEN